MSFGFECLRAFLDELKAKGADIARTAKKVGKDDPRRVIHSLKVGLALTLISLYYYFQPLYDGFGVDAMWAVLTVVLVFEFSVGATIGKLVNRIAATLSAGALSVGVHRLATLSGEIGEAIVLAFSVFLVGSVVTFTRFYPALKARYDYGLLIFLLTFCLVTVSGYGDDEVFEIAHKRLSTVIIGSFTAVAICVCICPVWIGADLHQLVVNNMEKLGDFLEEFGAEYFATLEDTEQRNDNSRLEGYKSVLNSKTTEENMANLARWEPCHGRFSRQCAYKLDALYCYLISEIKACIYRIKNEGYFIDQFGALLTQTAAEIESEIREPCMIICSECGKALKELAGAIRRSKLHSAPVSRIEFSKAAVENLKRTLNSQALWEDVEDILDVIPVLVVASQLIGVVSCIEKIAGAVNELASLAHFKSLDNTFSTAQEEPQNILHNGAVVPIPEPANHVIVQVHGSSNALLENNNSTETPVMSRS
ncbi:Aluminum-activated malate transporter [Parasponia andersonii]|uniref:Aluminum-activated malate transporter n=1 Tax=Parasponia andersonii TaxID=3476 RepID=A0A2P5BSN0_PARAD|nr:Aluminum-activated malate transporter [Parasponia andersonii]